MDVVISNLQRGIPTILGRTMPAMYRDSAITTLLGTAEEDPREISTTDVDVMVARGGKPSSLISGALRPQSWEEMRQISRSKTGFLSHPEWPIFFKLFKSK